MPIALLLPGDSPRSTGEDGEYVTLLAGLDTPLPPILVHRPSMKVIDGMHRLKAAFLRGQADIDVEFFEGTTEDAFLRAVSANVAHGLPLTRDDRRAAAARIMASHPQLSDREIARVAGLGAKAVATIRRSTTAHDAQAPSRIGRDGRVRPLSSAEGRTRAAELMREDPRASLRAVARTAGISPTTAGDVRRRLEAGQAPARVPRQPGDAENGAVPAVATAGARSRRRMQLLRADTDLVLEKLLRDPSLRHREERRRLLRLLQHNAIGTHEWSELAAAVPSHCGELVMSLAQQYAETWLGFARELDERSRTSRRLAVGE
ncbi:ParB N-terminal domain-containing protein [Kitasatospora nipponensis]|uniref:ParB N-terminal domain-containing protein n=1 Tax=Kitasatospora nipponensis TaxID=258049 RepID=A0ABP4GZ69_9ACTN